MKKLILVSAIICVTSISLQAKIWRVNNNAGVTADFTTAQAAHNGATAGDTLHLEPSLNSYGNLSMSKQLTVISTGSFISQNPGYQADIRAGYLTTLSISNAGANNSVIMVRYNGDIHVNTGVSNILLSNCATADECSFGCRAIIINNADNIIVRQCAVGSINYSNNSNGIILTNNIVYRHVISDATSDAIVTNNVINAAGVANPCSFHNSNVANNIFNFNNGIVINNSTLSNNLSVGNFLPLSNNNLNNVDMSTVFINNTAGFSDKAYQLKVGSPAIAAGVAGVDCGAFGGTTPFKLAVTPPIPSIFQLSVPATSAAIL